MEEANNTGKVIDFVPEPVFQLLPTPALASIVSKLGGHVLTAAHVTQLFLPFDFSKTPPATPAGLLPDTLYFYITAINAEKARFSGLDADKRILFVSPLASTTDYIYTKRTVACKPCGASPVIAAADLVHTIPATISLDGIRSLIQQPLGDDDHLLDLKITIGATIIILTKYDDLQKLHSALQEALYATVAVSFNKNSDSSVLASFSKVVITPESLPVNTIGLIAIPVAALTLTETDPVKYAGLNNFIVHFPSVKPTIVLTVNVPVFDASSKLFLDDQEVLAPGNVPHPQMPGYRQVTKTISNYGLYLNKRKQVTIQQGTKKSATTVNPITNYSSKTNTTTITITK